MSGDVFQSSLGDEPARPVQITFEIKRGTARQWAIRNPVLRGGEPGVETDTGIFKIGDGVTPWNQLDYYLTQDHIFAMVQEMINNSPGGGGGVSYSDFQSHIDSEDPHPVYDDGSSFILLYQNAKV